MFIPRRTTLFASTTTADGSKCPLLSAFQNDTSEQSATARNPAHHRADRRADDISDLVILEPFDVVQFNSRREILGNRVECHAQHLFVETRDDVREHHVGVGGHELFVHVFEARHRHQSRASAAAIEGVAEHRPQDAEQPRTHARRIAQFLERTPRPPARVLHGVFGIAERHGASRREAEEAIEVRTHKFLVTLLSQRDGTGRNGGHTCGDGGTPQTIPSVCALLDRLRRFRQLACMSSSRFCLFQPPVLRGRRLAAARYRALMVVGLASAPLGAQQPSLIGPGVSAELARLREAQVTDVAYDLALRVSAGDTATGRVTVSFTQRTPGDVVLDFRGLSVNDGQINGSPWPELAAAWNRHHLVIPANRLRTGRNSVQVAFATPVAQAGASIIRNRDVTDGNVYLYTLLVPSDANLLFPCFDQPDLKAKVRLSLTTPSSWRALANGAQIGADTAGALVTHRFTETPRLSTYLIAFAAGPWASVTRSVATTTRAAPVPVSLWMRQSRRAEAESDTLIAMNARALRWLGDWFGIPYAFNKFDALLAPAFPFGGMEHPGAVFYNEESFIYRERPTMSQLLGRQATTFHEVAHQWFGDYMTMRWFDDLWLKEGFATYMAARMQADLEPTSNAWKTFYLRNKPVAYATDATAGTTPIWQQLGNLDQAKSNYGPIVYNKAPGVIKQLEYLVGAAAFQRGVQDFLRTHAYGNGTWRELLGNVGRAAHRDLTAWGQTWMLRPGMPLVEQRLTVRNGVVQRLALVQRAAQPALSGRGAWPLKVQVLLYYANKPAVRLPVEMRGDTTVVTAAAGRPAPDFVFANDGDYGYAIVLPDSVSVQWLEQHIGSVPDDFLRAMLWGSLWDLVREARLSPTRYAEMVLRELPTERDEQITGTLVGRLVTIIGRYTESAARDALLTRTEPLLLRGAADSSRSYGQRKTQLDAVIGLARSEASLQRLDRWLDGDTAAGLALRPPTRWSIVTRLVARTAPTATTRLTAEARRDSTSEGQRQAFVADAARPDSAHKRALFTRWFADAALNEEWVTSSLRSFHDGDQAAMTRQYLVPALDTLPWIQQNRRIFFLGSWLGATLGGQSDAEALQLVDRWLAVHPTLALDLQQKIRQNRDELERTVRIRDTFAPK